MFRAVIPARYASTRLPGKPLAEIAGRPMIQHVHERVARSGAAEVIIATDDERVAGACRRFGAEVQMTSVAHRSGTDRLAEVATLRGWAPREVVVNVQGDEPLLPPELVRQAASLLQAYPAADIATLATPVTCIEELLDPSAVKVVRRGDGHALYFSRAPVPWHRDGAPAGITSQTDFRGALRHIGLYAYRVQALARLAAAPPSPLEEAESLEQLRALERGMTILVGDACVLPGPGVDTQADLEHVRALVQAGG